MKNIKLNNPYVKGLLLGLMIVLATNGLTCFITDHTKSTVNNEYAGITRLLEIINIMDQQVFIYQDIGIHVVSRQSDSIRQLEGIYINPLLELSDSLHEEKIRIMDELGWGNE